MGMDKAAQALEKECVRPTCTRWGVGTGQAATGYTSSRSECTSSATCASRCVLQSSVRAISELMPRNGNQQLLGFGKVVLAPLIHG